MLGVRLDPETEKALAAHAARVGRTKSAIVRDWVREALKLEARETWVRKAAKHLAVHNRREDDIESDFDD